MNYMPAAVAEGAARCRFLKNNSILTCPESISPSLTEPTMTSDSNSFTLGTDNDKLSNQACSGSHPTLPLADEGSSTESPIYIKSQPHGYHRNIVEISHGETGTNQASARLSQTKIFSSIHIYFLQNSMNKSQLKLWRQRIAAMGGEIQNNFDEKTTHVVTEIKNIERVKHLLNIMVFPQYTEILSSKWISDSITNGALQAPNSYRLKGEPSSPLMTQHLYSAASSDFKSKRKRYEHSDTEDEDNAEILNGLTLNKENISQDIDIAGSKHVQNRQSVPDAYEKDASKTTDILINLIAEVKSGEISGLSDDESEILAKDPENKQDFMNNNKNDNNFDVNTWKMVKDRFVCMTSHVMGDKFQDPNYFIIEKFEVLQRYYELTQDQHRSISYRKAITAIKKHKKKLTSREEALKLFGVGQKTANKIAEIIETGHLRRLKNLENTIDSLELLSGIYGVGSRQAIKWINQGHRTLEDVRHHCQLNHTQMIGLKYYEELKERMPREEVAKISAIIQQTAHIIDHKLECTPMGSYRRGLETCGDIDIIITRNPSDGITHSGVLPKLLNILHNAGYLTDDLALPLASDSLSIKYMGIFQLPGGKHRHLDILMVPYNEMGAALLYFTGNDIFNRSIRLLARKKKMRLNQRGLFKDVFRGSAGTKITEGTIIAQKTEKEIFDALNVPWLEPHERNP